MNDGTIRYGLLAAVLLASAGCGDDGGAGPMDGGAGGDARVADGGPGDGGVDGGGRDAAVDSGPSDGGGIDAAGDGGLDGGAAACMLERLLVTTADFEAGTGETSVFDPGTGEVTTAADANEDTDTEPGLLAPCTPVRLERTLGRITVQDPADPLTPLRTIETDPAGTAEDAMFASNPQKVVAVSETKAYVIPLSLNEITVVDPTQSGFDAQIGHIDLSGFVKEGDEDGLVDAADAVLVGDLLYVAIGNTWYDASAFSLRFEGSQIVVIDTTTDEVIDVDETTEGVQAIELTGDNPVGGMWHDEAGGRLLVGTTGGYGVQDGGIEAVDLDSRASDGLVVTESEAGHDFAGFVGVDGSRAYLLTNPVYGGDGSITTPSMVWAFDATTGELEGEATVADGAGGMVLLGDALFVWDGTTLRRFNAASGAETTPGSGPWDLGGAPVFGAEPTP